ncbi:hypothetical protein EYC84_011963 [Monilinia fructicola]|uniref:Uncharacterized protein n=1 Tax=Monilinia fructicola TaxID=38448 RepID=A0A5M9J6A7_MONFR|nr:hypothetical protein EYC84_011963 [Monilinia fructicola]
MLGIRGKSEARLVTPRVKSQESGGKERKRGSSITHITPFMHRCEVSNQSCCFSKIFKRKHREITSASASALASALSKEGFVIRALFRKRILGQYGRYKIQNIRRH